MSIYEAVEGQPFLLNLYVCYSNSSTSLNIDLSKRYNKKINELPEQKIFFSNGYQFPEWRVVTKDDTIQLMRWGLVPNWFKEINANNIASKTINARIESLNQKPAFKSLVASKRCIVPSTGFFEWKTINGDKQSFFIYPENKALFSMAALFDTWKEIGSGKLLTTFTIITCESSGFMNDFNFDHNRMPLLLKSEMEKDWLVGEGKPQDYLEENFTLKMNAHMVDKRVLSGSNSNQESAQKLFKPKNSQLSLF
jgi:putative SOS response-associated peptidase YedK